MNIKRKTLSKEVSSLKVFFYHFFAEYPSLKERSE